MVTTTRPDPASSQLKQKSFLRRVVVPALIVLVGIAIILYPVVSTQWNNYIQGKVVDDYRSKVQDAPEEERSAALEAARAYNESAVGGPILDPWLSRDSEDNPEYQHYLDQLSGFPAMSQVTIPAIDSALPVYHGTSEETLQKGLGHLYGTSLPVGGEGSHSVITGHTGLTTSTMWDNLVDLEVGDAIYVNTLGEKMKYQVYDTEVVLPHETESLGRQDGKDLITLITCTPYGVNTHRLLIHAERVPLDPDDESAFDQKNGLLQWWMWALLVVALLAIAYLVYWLRKERKKSTDSVGDIDTDAGVAASNGASVIDDKNENTSAPGRHRHGK